MTALAPTASDDPPPGAQQWLWSPTSVTLISGERDAVLVDAQLTADQAHDLANWVAAHGKNLTAVYVTHGHGDHWFGLSVILERFPQARAFALPAVIERMRQRSTPELLAFWNGLFPGQLPDDLVLAEPLPDHTLELEGHDLVAVELGHTDTDHTTCLHVPEIGLVVAGDAVYNDVHQYLRESSPKAGGSGSPPSTPSNRCTHGPSSQDTSALAATTAPRSSRRPAGTFATSIESQSRRKRRGSCTTRSSPCTPNASTPACSGGRRVRSSRTSN